MRIGCRRTIRRRFSQSPMNPSEFRTVSAFLVNTGKHLILVDAGTGGWYGGPSFGKLATNLRRAGYTTGQVDLILLTHLHADHVGGLTTRSGNRVFPNARVYVAKADSDFWLSPEVAAKGAQGGAGILSDRPGRRRPVHDDRAMASVRRVN